ncbi:CoB--CoM heterodisulfide reductase iron-sulfur subunit B family protein [Pandoraea bronchicola]|uniref:CoB--CoM heterodisulfide reductase n=1 Tax=Pandoraea bronchicola TaxID=2508287 RepID=A0A5E5BQV3_9BURK|nr:CoB--CoM heterodisulfide reductase iron-sulfur subunit B family protein [Pandoraea bronchicola]VVE87445.1 CoB--CoM heterodisulfide reductase [Pandoraea bronchicola]
MRIAFYPGCSARTTCSELLVATHAVAERLGVELETLSSATCTGSREIRAADAARFVALNVRIIALAEVKGLDLMTICNTCTLNLIEAKQRVDNDSDLRARVNSQLAEEGLVYSGTARVMHLLWYLLEEVGQARLRSLVKVPLSSHRIAAFYGCHIVRPPSVVGGMEAQSVRSIETLAQILGCTTVEYSGRTSCCGFHCSAQSDVIPIKLSGRHVASAKAAGAHAMVTPCPLCHTVLDTYQDDMARDLGTTLDLPVLHLPQLVGLALGIDAAALGLARHVVSAQAVSRGA